MKVSDVMTSIIRSPYRWHALFCAFAFFWVILCFLKPNRFYSPRFFHLQIHRAGQDFDLWFLDSFAILAANDAVSAGRDPYRPNPFDYLNRPHVYSHWWLHLRDLGLTRMDNFALGVGLILTFFTVVMVWLRPRCAGALFWYLGVFCTVPVMLALDRANNDLVIFLLLTPLIPCLLSRHAILRWLTMVFVAVAAGLKFYPAIAALLLLGAGSLRECLGRAMLVTGLLILIGWNVAPDFVRFAPWIPQADGPFTFGAAGGFFSFGWHGPAPRLLAGILGAAMAIGCWWVRPLNGWNPAPERRSEWLHFILGAVLLTGCFFASQNYCYRWIFALWLAPLLWSLSHEQTAPTSVRRLAHATRWLLLAGLWIDAICAFALSWLPKLSFDRALDRIFLIEQPITWAFFGCLLVFLTHFAHNRLCALRSQIMERDHYVLPTSVE
jgi:hypothetical protein